MNPIRQRNEIRTDLQVFLLLIQNGVSCCQFSCHWEKKIFQKKLTCWIYDCAVFNMKGAWLSNQHLFYCLIFDRFFYSFHCGFFPFIQNFRMNRLFAYKWMQMETWMWGSCRIKCSLVHSSFIHSFIQSLCSVPFACTQCIAHISNDIRE